MKLKRLTRLNKYKYNIHDYLFDYDNAITKEIDLISAEEIKKYIGIFLYRKIRDNMWNIENIILYNDHLNFLRETAEQIR